jgi:hypothetical protein
MNKFITYSAMAKLQHLITSNAGITGIMITFSKSANKFNFRYLERVTYDLLVNDVELSVNPTIYTDLNTFRKLSEASIDFDYASDEFVITRDP